MKNPNRQKKYNVSEGNNQLVLILNSEILLPEDAPVRVTSAQLEELDYRKLYEAYSSKGRKSVTDPRVMFKVMAYGYTFSASIPIHSTLRMISRLPAPVGNLGKQLGVYFAEGNPNGALPDIAWFCSQSGSLTICVSQRIRTCSGVHRLPSPGS